MLSREISNNKFQVDSLDGLRGLAALLVVFSHSSLKGWNLLPFLDFKGAGKSGVFLFFLLSSFLLTLPLLYKGREIFSYSHMLHYWQRRFFRIYPLYFLYLFLGVVSTVVFEKLLRKTGVGVPFDLNISQFFGHLFLQQGKGVTWSIAVEFKFYFILPFIALIVAYLSEKSIKVAISFIVVALIATQLISPESESLTNDVRLFPYMPIFFDRYTSCCVTKIHQ